MHIDIAQCRAFAFDFYQTLVEVDQDVPPIWEFLNAKGYACSEMLQSIWQSDAFDGSLTPSYYGIPSYEDWRRSNLRSLARFSGVPVESLEALVDEIIDFDRSWTVKAKPFANAVLSVLKQADRRVGICSNWDYLLEPYLGQSSLVQVDALSVSAEVGARKPNLAIFQDICSKLGTSPEETAFIGDSWSADIAGALRAGLRPVWINHTNADCEIPHLVQEFSNLEDFFNHLNVIL